MELVALSRWASRGIRFASRASGATLDDQGGASLGNRAADLSVNYRRSSGPMPIHLTAGIVLTCEDRAGLSPGPYRHEPGRCHEQNDGRRGGGRDDQP